MSELVKFSDAGVGAVVWGARRLLPALENLPRTKPRGLSRRFYGESGLGWLVFRGCGTVAGSNCRDLALVFLAELGPIRGLRGVSRRVKIAAGISSASGRGACRCTAACRGFAPVTWVPSLMVMLLSWRAAHGLWASARARRSR